MSDNMGTQLENGTDRVLHRLERIYADLDARLERLVELTRAKATDAMREPRPTTGIGHEGRPYSEQQPGHDMHWDRPKSGTRFPLCLEKHPSGHHCVLPKGHGGMHCLTYPVREGAMQWLISEPERKTVQYGKAAGQ
jgi:hypothetical protein